MLTNVGPTSEPPSHLRGDASSRFERREAQVSRILIAARACFLKSGFQGASMGEICAAANMSPGALYRYFPSKESLVDSICAMDKESDAKILSSIAKSPSIVDGMTAGLLAHAEQVHLSGMAPLFAEIFAEAMRSPTLKDVMDRSMNEAFEVIYASLVAAVERGEIQPVLPLPQLLPIMMALGHGLVTHDLPRHGIATSTMEPAIRAMIVGFLRPRQSPDNLAENTNVQSSTST